MPYSLNRKGRWGALNTAGSDILQARDSFKARDSKVKISVVEADSPVWKDGVMQDGTLGVKAHHELDSAGTIVSHFSKSKRGANLKSLLNNTGEKITEEELAGLGKGAKPLEEVDLNVRYLISKPHPVLAPKIFRGKAHKLTGRRGNVSCGDAPIQSRPVDRTPAVGDGMVESMDENRASDELLLSYTRPQRLYSLADFVKENATHQPVFVRNKSVISIAEEGAKEGDSNHGFELVGTEVEHRGGGGQSEVLKAPPLQNALKRQLEEVRHGEKWIFETLKLQSSSVGILDGQSWMKQCVEVENGGNGKLVWISQSRILVDLTPILCGEDRKRESPQLICAIHYLEAEKQLSFLVNGVFDVPNVDKLAQRFAAGDSANLVGLLKLVVEETRLAYQR